MPSTRKHHRKSHRGGFWPATSTKAKIEQCKDILVKAGYTVQKVGPDQETLLRIRKCKEILEGAGYTINVKGMWDEQVSSYYTQSPNIALTPEQVSNPANNPLLGMSSKFVNPITLEVVVKQTDEYGNIVVGGRKTRRRKRY